MLAKQRKIKALIKLRENINDTFTCLSHMHVLQLKLFAHAL